MPAVDGGSANSRGTVLKRRQIWVEGGWLLLGRQDIPWVSVAISIGTRARMGGSHGGVVHDETASAFLGFE